jgi:hypothetical protein
LTLNEWTQDLIRYEKAHKYVLNSNVAFTLGGKKARLVTFHGTLSDGTKLVAYSVIAVNGTWTYEFDWFSPKGHEAADLAIFKQILGTFSYKA